MAEIATALANQIKVGDGKKKPLAVVTEVGKLIMLFPRLTLPVPQELEIVMFFC